MRAFWFVLALLVLVAGGWVYTTRIAPAPPVNKPAVVTPAPSVPSPDQANRGVEPAKENVGVENRVDSNTESKASDGVAPAVPAVPAVPETAAPPSAQAPVVEAPKAEPASVSGALATDPATAQAGVVRITLTGTDGKPLSLRVGFKMAADLVVTPAHLIDSAISGTVTTSTGQSVPIIGTVAIDQARDIAIFRLAQPIAGTTALRFVQTEAGTEAPAFVLPLQGSPVVMAKVLGYRTDTVQGRRVQIKAMLPSNAVGMPLVSDKGELIGMVTGTDPSGAPLVASAAEIAGLPRGQVTPLTTTAVAKAAADPSKPAPPPVGPAKESKTEAASEAKIEKKADGSMLVDEKYTVKGEGTKDKPYEITWELLMSVQEVYDPRKGQKKFPGRILMLDGKWVTITGYVAFPLYVDQPKELLSMLNQWDGCCIGVPPTPYDAIEVRLTGVASKDDRLATFGSVTGKLSIKPYLVGDWVVGIYIMDDTTFTAKRFGGFGS